ncbi:addiction module protein [Synechococcus sp. BA-132 BA5]|uniref:addiction module protein n=1 Tax=Synechococcus sp. BA-132 BA5 TaxID=3110252 RepID=UPI002B216830|nr:addiction module protein [Synechococcus sp. BA-132 BA5]MEA5416759.1 addiction module protein [Synechococcus sp. BA-132 BA5]
MAANLPLGQMSLEDKLEAMELLWADLSATPDQVVSPAWHRDELSRRREQLEQGSASFQSWNDAMTGLKAELRGYQAP